MKKIDLENYRRRALWEAFRDRDVPFFSVTAMVDITQFKTIVNQTDHGFFVSLSFLISKAVNSVPELRHRIIKGELFEFDRVDPGFTVSLPDRTFAFCDSRYFEDFDEYQKYATDRINEARKNPDCSTGEKHHMFFISNLPWISFTSITHPYDKKYASIPVISIGRYSRQNEKLIIPIGIQVHHGLVDGIHVAGFFERLSCMCETPTEHLR